MVDRFIGNLKQGYKKLKKKEYGIISYILIFFMLPIWAFKKDKKSAIIGSIFIFLYIIIAIIAVYILAKVLYIFLFIGEKQWIADGGKFF